MAASAAETRKKRMKSKSYGDVVISQLDNLRKNDELCDFTVKAEGKAIRVSRAVARLCTLKILWFALFSRGLIFTHFHFKSIRGILKFAHFEPLCQSVASSRMVLPRPGCRPTTIH